MVEYKQITKEDVELTELMLLIEGYPVQDSFRGLRAWLKLP